MAKVEIFVNKSSRGVKDIYLKAHRVRVSVELFALPLAEQVKCRMSVMRTAYHF